MTYTDVSAGVSAISGPVQDKAKELTPLTDSSGDAAPDPSRTIDFTVDLAACAREHGIETAGQSLNVQLMAAGESRPGGMDRAAESFFVRFPAG